MKYLLSIVKIIVIVILSVILLINIFILTSKWIFNQYPPKICGYFYATVMSGSMEPIFAKGDLLIFKEYENYQTNDIILFKEKESLITHRIIAIKDDKYITKGDANNTIDKNLLSINNIEGKMIKIVPNVGKYSDFFKSPIGLLIIIVVGFLMIEVLDIIYRIQTRRVKNDL